MYLVPDMLSDPLRKFRWITELGCIWLLKACKEPANAQQHFQILFQDRPIGRIEASRQGSEADRILRIRS